MEKFLVSEEKSFIGSTTGDLETMFSVSIFPYT